MEGTTVSLKGEVVLVTGASRGIGRGIATAFGREGAKVVVNYRSQAEAAQETARLVREAGGEAAVIQADVTRAEDVASMVERTEDQVGPISALVNNAGGTIRKDFLSTTETDWDWQFATNVKSVYLMCHAVATRMVQRKRGAIVNISSIDGHIAEENRSAYVASKGAVSMFSKALAIELIPYRIRVNAIAPGYIATEAIASGSAYPEHAEPLEKWMPMQRYGLPEEVGKAAVFLASDAASYVSGQILFVDGAFGARQAMPFPGNWGKAL